MKYRDFVKRGGNSGKRIILRSLTKKGNDSAKQRAKHNTPEELKMSQTTDDSTHHHTVDIDIMLENLSSSTPSKPSMFRVDEDLRSINPKAYDPEIIAIGPFHRGNENKKFQEMEQHKVRYLKLLLERERKRGNELSVETFITAIRKLEEEARKCYPEVELDQKFVQMLILDGCFIIEFLLKFRGTENPEEDDPIFQYGHIQSHVLHDLMVFENQIPFSIIKCLFKMICKGDLKTQILPWLENCISPMPDLPEEFKIDGQHLLGILHDIYRPSLSDNDSACHDIYRPSLSDNDSACPAKLLNINSAVELKEAGISFKKLKMEDINSAAEHKEAGNSSEGENKNSAEAKKLKKVMFHIEYGNKFMKIPEWKISDSTESLFRNLIAYEYYLPVTYQRYVTDYSYLMNCLVRSPEDAKLLRRCGIISNLLGSDEMVYDVINNLGKNIITSVEFSYLKIFSQVNRHCDNRWNEWMAMLRREYFYSPWAIISVFAAIFLLGLTVIQTVSAILSFL